MYHSILSTMWDQYTHYGHNFIIGRRILIISYGSSNSSYSKQQAKYTIGYVTAHTLSLWKSIHMHRHTNRQRVHQNNFSFSIFTRGLKMHKSIKILRSVFFTVTSSHRLCTRKSKIGKGFFFMQVSYMFHNINFLFRSIFTVRALEHCRFATFITSMSPQGAVSEVNFPTVVALEDSFLVCSWVWIMEPGPCWKYNK
jgi:hypothetical protein